MDTSAEADAAYWKHNAAVEYAAARKHAAEGDYYAAAYAFATSEEYKDAYELTVSEGFTVSEEAAPKRTRLDFEAIVKNIAAVTLFPLGPEHEIRATRLTGGSYNRVVAVGYGNTNYVVRIPRHENFDIGRSVAILELLKGSSLPVSRPVAHNEWLATLNSAYAVQTMLPGDTLSDVLEDLTFEQRKKLAKELGSIRRQLMSIKSRVGGCVALPPNFKQNPNQSMHIKEWGTEETKPYTNEYKQQDLKRWLSNLFLGKQKQFDRPNPRGGARTTMEMLVDMAKQMGDDGWLLHQGFCLSHQDLEPRNILVDLDPPREDEGEKAIISGIVDWDSAAFMPTWAACGKVPTWVWDPEEETDWNDKWLSEYEGHTKEARVLKALFDEAAGEEYVKYAYNDGWEFARELVYYATSEQCLDPYEISDLFPMWDEWRKARTNRG